MALFKEISLTSWRQPGHWNDEVCLSQEDVELGGDTSARGASANTPDKKEAWR